MFVHRDRSQAIRQTMAAVKETLGDGVTVEASRGRRIIFWHWPRARNSFPARTFRCPRVTRSNAPSRSIKNPTVDFALYVNSARQGQTYGPHDHGGSWAIVVAVEGRERHYMYRRTDDGSQEGLGHIELAAELLVEPGHGVTLLEDGIHSIEAFSEDPLLHLHCYGMGFDRQLSRKEYDRERGTYVFNNDVGLIEDFPLHPETSG